MRSLQVLDLSENYMTGDMHSSCRLYCPGFVAHISRLTQINHDIIFDVREMALSSGLQAEEKLSNYHYY